MNLATENSTKKPIETSSEKDSASVISLDFTPTVNEDQKKVLVKTDASTSFFKAKSGWQNVLAVAAIVAVAVLHFVIQTSFIQSETGKDLVVEEVPLKIKQIPQPSVEIEFQEFEAKKINDVTPKPVPAIKQRRVEIVPPNSQPKKKTAVETRTERLRRAEKILTGF